MNYTLDELKKRMDRHGNLYLSYTKITALPENLTVGGWLDLRNTPIAALPENLTVGGSLNLSYTPIFKIRNTLKYRKLKEAEYVPGKYLYVDGILTHIKRGKKVGKYTYYIGKIQNQNVISDGERYAHCKDFQSGVRDLEFKSEKDRGAEQYKNLDLSSTVTYEKAIMMYRIITGACQAGTEHFLAGLKEIKPEYTIAEIIKLTKGNYGARTFEEFFAKKGERA